VKIYCTPASLFVVSLGKALNGIDSTSGVTKGLSQGGKCREEPTNRHSSMI